MKKKKINLMYILIGICAAGLYVAGNGLANCLGLFYRSLASAIGGGIGSVSLCVTIGSVITGFTAKMMPVILKKIPFKAIIALGMSLLAGGIFGSAFATSLGALIACFIVKGLGGCLIGMTMINYLVDNWFYKGSGTVLGIAMSMSGVIAAIMSPVFGSMIEGIGWKYALGVFALASMLFCLPALLIATADPTEKAMEPYGSEEKGKDTSIVNNAAADIVLVKDFTYYTVIAIMFLSTVSLCMASHIATYASSINLMPATGALLVSTCMIGNMVFKLIIGFLCDRINPIRTSIITFSFVALSFVLFLLGTTVTWVNFAAAACFGAAFGCSTVAVGQVIKMLFARELFCKVFASALMTSSIASAIFGTLLGYFYDWFGTYIPAFGVLLALSVVAVVLLLILNKRLGRWNPHQDLCKEI